MISVNDAIKLIRETVKPLAPVTVPLQSASGLVLAEDVIAAVSIPHFNQSAMDGYAFRFADLAQTKTLGLCGEVAAGEEGLATTPPRHAVRIFTGAPLPPDVDTVVMQEKTTVADGQLTLLDEQLVQGSNVRLKGAEINEGELALAKGTVLTPAAVGFLAALGTPSVRVHPKPTVHLIITGKELQQPGTPLKRGRVYESNSVMLQAALEQLRIAGCSLSFANDDLQETTSAIASALHRADLVLLTGGVSVGVYDYVVKAAEQAAVQQVFHKVAQRPGKPLYCGNKDGKLVFGLPGNPASVLSCFYNFVVPALEELTARKEMLVRRQLPLLVSIQKKIALTQFLKATCNGEGVKPLAAQESFRLSSFSAANCLIVLPEEKRDYAVGDTVEVLLLPYL